MPVSADIYTRWAFNGCCNAHWVFANISDRRFHHPPVDGPAIVADLSPGMLCTAVTIPSRRTKLATALRAHPYQGRAAVRFPTDRNLVYGTQLV